MGLFRDTFYRYQNAVEQGGIDALVDQSRRKPNIKNRTEETIEAAVVAYAVPGAASYRSTRLYKSVPALKNGSDFGLTIHCELIVRR